jgi:hypothetical protein
MKAIRFHSPGGPEVLRPDDLPVPVAQPGGAQVRVRTAGVNQADNHRETPAPDCRLKPAHLEGVQVPNPNQSFPE